MTLKFSKIISYTLHPIVFPIIGTLLYFIFLPRHIDSHVKNALIVSVFIATYIIPLFFMFLLKRMKLIETYYIKTMEERKFPLIFLTVLSYLLGVMLYRTGIVPELSLFFFGITLTLLIAYLFTYIDFKISLHTIGVGGLIGFIALLSFAYELNLIVFLAFFFVIAGSIASSRLKLEAHKEKEVYLGFLIGLLSQVIVYVIYNM